MAKKIEKNEKNVKNKIIVICGPTASGKTYTAIELAKIFNGEIISADSMQIYRELNIGTAKPDEEEMQGIKHHLIDIISISDSNLHSYSVSDYVNQAGECAEDIINSGKLPIICGGTGLYIDHFIKNTKFVEYAGTEDYRNKLAELSNEELYSRLTEIDPKSAEIIHMNNKKRVIRALEIYYTTGKTKSELDALSQIEGERYEFRKFGLRYTDRELLYSRINKRVDEMMAGGLCEEVHELYTRDKKDDIIKTGAIGYVELVDYFDGGCTLDEAVEMIKKNTRNYAKRQITWFKRDENTIWIDIDADIINSPEKIIKKCVKYI